MFQYVRFLFFFVRAQAEVIVSPLSSQSKDMIISLSDYIQLPVGVKILQGHTVRDNRWIDLIWSVNLVILVKSVF